MVGIGVNLVVACALLVWGMLLINRSPSTEGFMDWVQERVRPLAGGDYHVPFYLVGLGFLVLGLFALVNAVMILAAGHGFWVV